ncbi:MAG: hydantoinase/oxoprolinase family protein [Chlamydiia bacterium]|nr:hydantoinase/oxoprolinase family protein [Chlamydiia bacterium]
MKKSYIVGVDIGGTNTDAVLVDDQKKVISAAKTTTTNDISIGFATVLKNLIAQSAIQPDQIHNVFIGTTHATNAILQKNDLFRVGVIRIAGQRPQNLPVAFSWPVELKKAVIGGVETVSGGWECHGGSLTLPCKNEIRRAIECLLENQVDSIAVVGVFSPLNGDQEKLVLELIQEIAGKDFPISLSHEVGGIGFIERENSTILNASLKRVMQQGFYSLQAACQNLKLTCPLIVTQNDGSLIDIERAINYPVLTISAGPTNSFIGGARLAGLENAIVVDIGGTSTDVGLVRNGFPIRSLNKSNIGGVSLNFPMPDVLSVALGGGSIIRFNENKTVIGPTSVAKSLTSRALCFGGNELTLTDAALVMGHLEIKESQPVRALIDPAQGSAIFDQVKQKLNDLIIKIRGEYKALPIIFVGGGSALLPSCFFAGEYQMPSFFNVANAYGAALSEISGMIDTVVSLQNREEVLSKLYEQAKQKALDQGAEAATLRLVDQQIIPYSYVPNQMARVIVRYCGKKS